MKNKLFWLVALLTFCNSAFAVDSAIEYRVSPKRSAIQSTNMVFSDSIHRNVPSLNSYNIDIEKLENQIKENPENFEAHALLATNYIRIKNYGASFDVFNKMLEVQDTIQAQPTVLKEVDKARKILRYSTRNNANVFDVYSNLVMVNLLLGEKDLAQNALYAASQRITNEDVFYRIFSCLYNTDDEKSISVIENLIKLNPNELPLKKIKANLLLDFDKKSAAEKELISILQKDENSVDSRIKLYNLLKEQNLSENKLLKKLYPNENVSNEHIYLELTNLLNDTGNVNDAKMFASKLVENYPQNGQGYLFLAENYMNDGNLKDAYQLLLLSRDKLSTNEMISKYNELLAKLSGEPVREADSLMNNGLYAEALNVLSSASQEDLYVILGLARANYFLGNKQVAYEALNKAMSLYPNNEDVFYYFSYILYKDGDLENSRKYLNKTLNIKPAHKYALQLQDILNKADADKYFNQIIGAFEVQNYEEAMRLINEALSINKKDSALYYYQGLTYIAMNNYAAATAPLYKALELDKNNVIAYFYLGLAFDNLSERDNALSNYKEFIRLLPPDNYGEADKLNYAKLRVEKLSK